MTEAFETQSTSFIFSTGSPERNAVIALIAAPDCPWTPAEQAEIWRRTANVFWPQARGAACRDAEVRAACAPGLTACKALWKLGDENTRPDWKLFAFLLNHFGPRFALWAAGLLKRK